MSDLGDDEMVPDRGHRCTIKRKRRGQMRSGEHGICEGCGTEYTWSTAPFQQWQPRFAGTPFPGAHSKRRRAARHVER